MTTVEGLCGIKATTVCDSISERGDRLTTMELEYPRIIHAEMMTHRMFSRNAASSRAIPFAKMQEQLTARPVRFGAANKGMQDAGEHTTTLPIVPNENPLKCYRVSPEDAWHNAKLWATEHSEEFMGAGYHKQVYNRLTEPFQMIKVLVSATEWDNFFWLRCDEGADPTLQELARCMKEAQEVSTPQILKAGEWHLPYVVVTRHQGLLCQEYWADNDDGTILTLGEAIKVSAARCAAVSYRNEDYGLEKCLELYKRLVGAERKHSSALEHQATPMQAVLYGIEDDNEPNVNQPMFPHTWEPGVSHADRQGKLWSGNFKQWIQHRKFIIGENHES